MKKLLSVFLLSLVLILSACGSDEPEKETPKAVEEPKQDEVKKDDPIEEISQEQDEKAEDPEEAIEETPEEEINDVDELDEAEVIELLEYGALSEDDSLIDLVIKDGEIKAVVEIGDNEIINDKSMLAEVVYASAGDELLQKEGWEVLTIEFVDIGKVSMHRDEKGSNEYGDYFPIEEIMKQLGNE